MCNGTKRIVHLHYESEMERIPLQSLEIALSNQYNHEILNNTISNTTV